MPGLREILVVVKGPFHNLTYIGIMLQALRRVDVEYEDFWVRVPLTRGVGLHGINLEEMRFRRLLEVHNYPFNVLEMVPSILILIPGLNLLFQNRTIQLIQLPTV